MSKFILSRLNALSIYEKSQISYNKNINSKNKAEVPYLIEEEDVFTIGLRLNLDDKFIILKKYKKKEMSENFIFLDLDSSVIISRKSLVHEKDLTDFNELRDKFNASKSLDKLFNKFL